MNTKPMGDGSKMEPSPIGLPLFSKRGTFLVLSFANCHAQIGTGTGSSDID